MHHVLRSISISISVRGSCKIFAHYISSSENSELFPFLVHAFKNNYNIGLWVLCCESTQNFWQMHEVLSCEVWFCLVLRRKADS